VIAPAHAWLHVVHGELFLRKHATAIHAAVAVAGKDFSALHMPPDPLQSRRLLFGAARKFLLDREEVPGGDNDAPPRLTLRALESTRMARSRERIMANLDEMYREAFERAKAGGDEAQQATLDFAYRREQLYFEILLDVRDAVERRG
jgi:hypothetical protein